MIKVVFTMKNTGLVEWQFLVREVAYHFSNNYVSINSVIDPQDSLPKLEASIEGKTEWVLGEDDHVFDQLVERQILASYETRGAATIRQAVQLSEEDTFAKKYEDMAQLLGEDAF